MLSNKQAVIFDLDGTLVDSMWMWKSIDIEYLGKHGVQMPQDLQKNISGMSFSETARYFKEEFRLSDSIDEIKQAWNDMAMYKYTHEVEPKVGVISFLQHLKNNGIRTGIATSNSVELVTAVLDTLQMREYFDEVHTSCEVEHGKPEPDIYLYVADCLGVDPKHCLVFEDISQGILAGKAAGMEVCAIEDDFSAEEREEKKKLADYYITDYTELMNLWQR